MIPAPLLPADPQAAPAPPLALRDVTLATAPARCWTACR